MVVQILGKNTIGYFGNVYDMSIPDPKNKQNEYTFTSDCMVLRMSQKFSQRKKLLSGMNQLWN